MVGGALLSLHNNKDNCKLKSSGSGSRSGQRSVVMVVKLNKEDKEDEKIGGSLMSATN